MHSCMCVCVPVRKQARVFAHVSCAGVPVCMCVHVSVHACVRACVHECV